MAARPRLTAFAEARKQRNDGPAVRAGRYRHSKRHEQGVTGLIRTTPFHPRTSALNETGLWEHWSNHLAAVRYQASEKFEYFAIRNSAGLFDSSPLYKYRVAGPDAERYLAGVLTRDVRELPLGRAQYTLWCDDRGFVLEDGILLRLAPDEFLLTAAEPNLAYFDGLRGKERVRIEEVTDAFAILAVQGPRSRTILAPLVREVVDLRPFGLARASVAGVDVIVQGALRGGSWAGRADILQRAETPSDLGDWSYEAADTKLARETKGGTVLQLCLYSELIGEVQGTMPVFASVIPPWTDFEPERYRLADFAAYHRQVKQGLLGAIGTDKPGQTYPEPTSNCDICNWSTRCDKQRRDDDHLCLVAGISSMQITELKDHDVTTATVLAELPLPLQWKPERGSKESLTRVREQARIQLERAPRPLPTMRLNPAVRSLFDFKYGDFTLENYDPHPGIKAPIAV